MTLETIEATNLAVGFLKEPIAANIGMSLRTGEIVAIAGPNGVGKSTIVKTLARQLKPLQGTVKLGETSIWEMTSPEFASKVAYVPQNLEPGQNFTVEEMVMLGRNPHQKWWQWYASKIDTEAVELALNATEMMQLRTKSLSELSGGERQRASLATALAQEPKFLILDEPTSHLDFRHQLDLLSQLKTLRDKGIGCLIVLHDLNLIARIADRVVLLRTDDQAPSTVAASGTTDQVLTKQNLATVFDVEVQIFNDPEFGETVYQPLRRAQSGR